MKSVESEKEGRAGHGLLMPRGGLMDLVILCWAGSFLFYYTVCPLLYGVDLALVCLGPAPPKVRDRVTGSDSYVARGRYASMNALAAVGMLFGKPTPPTVAGMPKKQKPETRSHECQGVRA